MLPLLFGMALVLGICEPQFFGLWEGLVWAKFSSYWAVRQIFIYLIAGCTYFGSIEPFLDLQIQLDFSHRVGSGREAWAQHITNWRTVTTPLGLVASYCSSYHHISICLLDAFCIMDPYFGHQLLYVHMTAMYILLKGAPFEVQCES